MLYYLRKNWIETNILNRLEYVEIIKVHQLAYPNYKKQVFYTQHTHYELCLFRRKQCDQKIRQMSTNVAQK